MTLCTGRGDTGPTSFLGESGRSSKASLIAEALGTLDEPRVNPQNLAYLNRLSSLLYALARYVNFKSGISEEHPTYD